MKGWLISDITWVNDVWGFQRIIMPPNKLYSGDGRRRREIGGQRIKLSHVKVWRRNIATGERIAVKRTDTIPEARRYIKGQL